MQVATEQRPAVNKLELGTAVTWAGVVQVERPSPNPGPLEMCKVYSARHIAFNGARAIFHLMPYSQVRHYFQSDDEDIIHVEADLRDGHLQLYGRSDFKGWAHFSGQAN